MNGLILASAIAVLQPMMSQEPEAISAGPWRMIGGELTDDSRTARGGVPFNCYVFQGQAGQRVNISITTIRFEKRLSLHAGGTCDGRALVTTSPSPYVVIDHTLTSSGTFSVRAGGRERDDRGTYALDISVE